MDTVTFEFLATKYNKFPEATKRFLRDNADYIKLPDKSTSSTFLKNMVDTDSDHEPDDWKIPRMAITKSKLPTSDVGIIAKPKSIADRTDIWRSTDDQLLHEFSLPIRASIASGSQSEVSKTMKRKTHLTASRGGYRDYKRKVGWILKLVDISRFEWHKWFDPNGCGKNKKFYAIDQDKASEYFGCYRRRIPNHIAYKHGSMPDEKTDSFVCVVDREGLVVDFPHIVKYFTEKFPCKTGDSCVLNETGDCSFWHSTDEYK
jgi:hypothetical protein